MIYNDIKGDIKSDDIYIYILPSFICVPVFKACLDLR